MSDKIWFDPTSDKWVLSDDEHYLEVPHWAREIIVNEFEREAGQLKDELQRRTEQLNGMVEMWVERGVENAKIRELLQRTWDAFHDATAREFVTVKNELRELGIEVEQ